VEHGVYENRYRIDLDNGRHLWEEDEFDPGYRPDDPLSPEDAIRAMLDGETLYDDAGRKCRWASEGKYFALTAPVWPKIWDIRELPVLYRRPKNRKRIMDRLEIIAWVNSEKSLGWMAQCGGSIWTFPRHFSYTGESEDYQRAHLLPDLSDVDPDTVQRFEVEE
jgi:hypothetical protein